jgi:hypothetical protein
MSKSSTEAKDMLCWELRMTFQSVRAKRHQYSLSVRDRSNCGPGTSCAMSERYIQYEFHPVEAVSFREWKTLEPGISELVMNHDSATGRRTTLQRWEPGARNATTSLHTYCEEIYIVEGDLRVIPGRGTAEGKSEAEVDWWSKGAYAFRKPVRGRSGSAASCADDSPEHAAWSVREQERLSHVH